MAKFTRKQGQPISEREKQWARLLYRRGLTFVDIERKTGISHASLSNFARDGEWNNDKNPPFDAQDLIETLMEHAFEVLLDIRTGKIQDSDVSRAILDLKNLVLARREIEELLSIVNLRNMLEALKWAMEELAKGGASSDTLDTLQELYDRKVKEL